MKKKQIKLTETGNFESLFINYLDGNEKVKNFYKFIPSLDGLKESINNRLFVNTDRNTLVKVLEEQYSDVEIASIVSDNIQKLKAPTTFTVTTGHQLNLLTGPLFFVYKILSVINTCELLKNSLPEYDFVPVFWMASEDHDFPEINNFSLFGREYTWESSQSGAVGRFSTDGISDLLSGLPDLPSWVKEAYKPENSLSQATRVLVNHMFGKYGLVILDPDKPQLKRLFENVIKEEIQNSTISNCVKNTTEKIKQSGFETQVFPRDVNLFFIDGNARQRIDRIEKGKFLLLPETYISEKELLEKVNKHPECFSPNVVLRPLYQETILPNIAYIGGPAEVSYWLQLKDAFENMNVHFPVILPRNFNLYLDKGIISKMRKLNISEDDLFQSNASWKELVLKNAGIRDVNLEEEAQQLQNVFSNISGKAKDVDPSLEGYVLSECRKLEKVVLEIKKRIKKAEENKHEVLIRQVESLYDKVFPGGSLQERKENVFSFLINNEFFIDNIKELTDPLEFKFNIFSEEH